MYVRIVPLQQEQFIMAILITKDRRHLGELKISIAYWPLVDAKLQRYVDDPSSLVEETTPGEIDSMLAEQLNEENIPTARIIRNIRTI